MLGTSNRRRAAVGQWICLAKRVAAGLLFCTLCLTVSAQAQNDGSLLGSPVKKSGKGTPLTPNGRPLIAEFSATWCGPCKKFQPTYQKVSQSFADRADFVSIDVDARSDVAMYYHVENIPTVLILDARGKQKWRHAGILTEQELTNRINKVTGSR